MNDIGFKFVFVFELAALKMGGQFAGIFCWDFTGVAFRRQDAILVDYLAFVLE